MKHNPHLFPLSILLEAKLIYFGPTDSPSRHRRNVLRRMAFANAFLPRAKKTDLGIAINKDHATVIHYSKGHEWHLNNYPEYTELYRSAKEVFKKYDTPVDSDKEFLNIDNAAMLNLIVDLKDKVYKQSLTIEVQGNELDDLRRYKKSNEKAKKLLIEDLKKQMELS